MKVNNIQSYNQSNYNQNFTAMRFRSGSTKYVSSLPNNILNKLDEIGKFLADTQYYHFDIADNFYTLKDVLTPDEYYDAIFCIQEEEE